MAENYSQIRAMLAITKAGLQSMLKSPSAIMFSIGFPLVFILVFGFMGGNGKVNLDIAIAPTADTANPIYAQIIQSPGLKIKNESAAATYEDLEKGRITAILDIQKNTAASPAYLVKIKTSKAVLPANISVLQTILRAQIGAINAKLYPNTPSIAVIDSHVEEVPGRVYRMIDFILPGMLGFSLLSAGIFGVAFLFFNLRQQLVLKRFFATPISKAYIVVGEAISRVIFQLFTAVIIIVVGVVAFKFTLVHGWLTFFSIMLLSFFALIIFMGCGFIVSSVAKTESTIPAMANIFTMPQFLLAGTFFPIDSFPSWLQKICNLLPLTHFNHAMREISFEGASLISCWPDLANLAVWGIIVYFLAIKLFRWE